MGYAKILEFAHIRKYIAQVNSIYNIYSQCGLCLMKTVLQNKCSYLIYSDFMNLIKLWDASKSTHSTSVASPLMFYRAVVFCSSVGIIRLFTYSTRARFDDLPKSVLIAGAGSSAIENHIEHLCVLLSCRHDFDALHDREHLAV